MLRVEDLAIGIFVAFFRKPFDNRQAENGFVFVFARTVYAGLVAVFWVHDFDDPAVDFAFVLVNLNDRNDFSGFIVDGFPFSGNGMLGIKNCGNE